MKNRLYGVAGKRIFVLFWMVLFDFILHLTELLGFGVWLNFASRFQYTLFWTIYWGFALLLIVSLVIERIRGR